MVDPDNSIMSLDNLFFEKPVVHIVKPLHQEASLWFPQLEVPPSLSHIPASQEMQDEADSLSNLFGFSQGPEIFLPPYKGSAGLKVLPAKTNSSYSDENEIETQDGSHSTSHYDGLSGGEGFRDYSQGVWQRGRGGDEMPDPAQMACWSLDHSRSPTLRRSLFKDQVLNVEGDSPNSDDRSGSQTASRTQAFFRLVTMATAPPPHRPPQTTVSQAAPPFPPALHFASPPPLGSSAPGSRPPQDTKRVSIPPMTPQPLRIQGSSGSGMLRPVSEIPAKFRSVFSDFPFFNCVQSQALDDLLYTGKNFVACAPTGSGKTVLFELAIIRLLMETSEPWRDVKAVYMAPIKALCSQCFESWQKKFRPLGLSCKELTGDTEIDDFFEIQDSHIILTTPEKWDSMTRKWKDNCLLQLVRLFLIDEVHVVKDATRGATLEVVVSRMKAVNACRAAQSPGSGPSMRFVAVSATIPNVSDIADWLSDHTGPATYMDMDESYRPVKLRRVVLGFPCNPNQTQFKFDLSLNYKMANIIQTYAEQQPALVFCSTRKGAQQAAAVLAKDARFIMSVEHKQRLMKYANTLLDSKLRDLVTLGVGYHHAGVDLSDRKAIEKAFTQADLPVLFTTRTLAMGVNLPAHLVVVKSTTQYVAGSCEEYSEADLLQMIGRAGRPQFDTSATAVIMTQIHTRDKYLELMNGMEIIESSLHGHLVEHLNAEIVLQTISDVNMALDWIRSTFLYIRALKNPTHYGFSADLDRHGIESKLQELCLRNLNSLSSIGLIDMDEDINIKPTDAGRLMARFYVACDTMKQFGEVSGTESLSDLIDLVSRSREFSHLQLRVNEKRPLNTLNRDKNKTTIRFPVAGKIRTTEMKVNCLIQAQLGSISVPEFGLTQDTAKIFRNGMRISKCLSEFLSPPSKTGFSALLNSLILAKCFRARLWENSAYVSKQLEKIGQSLSTAMVNAGLTTFSRIEQTHPRELELILNRHPPFGNQIRESVVHLPQYEVALQQLPRYSCEAAEVVVKVTLKNQAQLLSRRTAPDHHYVSLIIGDSDNSVVFLHKLRDLVLLKTGSWSKKVAVAKASKGQEISVNLISSEYVGLDVQQRFTVFYSGAPRSGADGSYSLTCDGPAQRDSHWSAADTGSASVRVCNHYCRNKDLCGHDCCKVGVAVTRKRSASQESGFSSYLKDLRSRSDSLTQTPVKRLKVKMREESVSASVQQFPSKPKERLVYRYGGRAHVRPPSGGEWAALPEEVHLGDVHRDDGQLYMMKMEESIQTAAAPQNLHQGSSVWSPAFSAGVNQDNELHLNQISRFINPQSSHHQSPPSSLVPTITFELGEEWDDWGDDDDDNLVNAAETLVASSGSAEPRVQQSDCSRTGLVSCHSLKPRASRSPLRSTLSPEITNTQQSPVRPQGRTRRDWNNKRPAQFMEAVPVGPVEAQTGTPMIPPGRSFGFFTEPSSSSSIRRSGREEEAFFGIFDGIF